MNPCAANHDGAWRRRAATVPVVQTAFPAISGVLGALFVNFKLFSVIFI